MLLNSGLTFNQSGEFWVPETFRFAEVNLLDDEFVPKNKHQSQHDRLELGARVMREINPDVLFVSEGVSPEHLERYAKLTDLEIAGEPKPVNMSEDQTGDDEWLAFLTRPGFAREVEVELIAYDYSAGGFVEMRADGERYIGVHYAHRIFADWGTRILSTRQILERTGKPPTQPTIVTGDFNDVQRHHSRMLYTQNGFTEAHSAKRPRFPLRHYRGKSVNRFVPSWNLDAIYPSTEHFKVVAADSRRTRAHDHPVPFVDLARVASGIVLPRQRRAELTQTNS